MNYEEKQLHLIILLNKHAHNKISKSELFKLLDLLEYFFTDIKTYRPNLVGLWSLSKGESK